MKKILIFFIILYFNLDISVLCHPVELLKILDDLKVNSEDRVGIFSNSSKMKKRSKSRESVRNKNSREMQIQYSSAKT
ncbi:uncharacterized protein cubi_02524, partial [Cryptosporidium ubiquitum]